MTSPDDSNQTSKISNRTDEVLPHEEPTALTQLQISTNENSTLTKHKSKLNTIVGDGSFSQLIQERTKIRKEKDEHSIAELRVQITLLEKSLASEIKRRIESHKKMECICEERVSALKEHFDSVILEHSNNITARVDRLESKVESLQDELVREKKDIPKYVEKRGGEVKMMLEDLREEFTLEKKERLNREGRILKQLVDHEEYVQKEMEHERIERQETVDKLKGMILKNESGRKEVDDGFQLLVNTELGKLRKELEMEIQEREVEDDEIVDALNRYTSNLQSSLSVISSGDN